MTKKEQLLQIKLDKLAIQIAKAKASLKSENTRLHAAIGRALLELTKHDKALGAFILPKVQATIKSPHDRVKAAHFIEKVVGR